MAPGMKQTQLRIQSVQAFSLASRIGALKMNAIALCFIYAL